VNFSRDFLSAGRYKAAMSSTSTVKPGLTNANGERVRVRVPERHQVVMTCGCLDDRLAADHPARAVWAVVDALDLSAFVAGAKAVVGTPGRDPTDPRVLLALWLYAAVDGVGSAREVDRLRRTDDAYRWLAGGLSLNHHTLSDFRGGHGAALDDLFTRVIAALVDKGLVTVRRISQDGTRERACAGAASFRRGPTLDTLLAEAEAHVRDLRARLDDPEASAALSARRKAAMERAARERVDRVAAAAAALPELERKQAARAKTVSAKDKKAGKLKEPRASTTDADARVMKMPDGGFRPAVNVQLAVDTASRAIVGVDVVAAGVDAGLAEPMRAQVEARAGRKVEEHLVDGGYLVLDEVERAAAAGVAVYVPPKPPRNRDVRGTEYDPRPTDSDAVKAWRARMGSEAGKAVYKERAATVETVNADLKTHRNLGRLLVRGLAKAKCVALLAALAYNVIHFAAALSG
jgi:transposase